MTKYEEVQKNMEELQKAVTTTMENNMLDVFNNGYKRQSVEEKLLYFREKFDGIRRVKPCLINLKPCTCEDY